VLLVLVLKISCKMPPGRKGREGKCAQRRSGESEQQVFLSIFRNEGKRKQNSNKSRRARAARKARRVWDPHKRTIPVKEKDQHTSFGWGERNSIRSLLGFSLFLLLSFASGFPGKAESTAKLEEHVHTHGERERELPFEKKKRVLRSAPSKRKTRKAKKERTALSGSFFF
jgi:hypothetical protein